MVQKGDERFHVYGKGCLNHILSPLSSMSTHGAEMLVSLLPAQTQNKSLKHSFVPRHHVMSLHRGGWSRAEMHKRAALSSGILDPTNRVC